MLARLTAGLALSSLVAAHLGGDHSAHRRHAHAHADHSHEARGAALPDDWFHPRDHPVSALFERTPEEAARHKRAPDYPPFCQQGAPSANPADMPLRWVAAYNAAKAAGRIPNVPPSTLDPAGNPVYPGGRTGVEPEICSATKKCRRGTDLWDAPAGILAVSFDDGPLAIAPDLYSFLDTNKIPSTHFMIGCAIRGDLSFFDQAVNMHASIAVHTWSHPMMTTLPDLAQVAELGWTMQIIADRTGGRVARYWRPPRGDCDDRCRAIATHVFGLTTVIWNADSEDWRMSDGYPGSAVGGNLTNWLNGPKTPGLMILEHELSADTVNFFKNTTYPLAVKNNWNIRNIPQAFAQPFYQNAAADTGAVTPMQIGQSAPATHSTLPTVTSTSTSTSTTTTATSSSTTTVSRSTTLSTGTTTGTNSGTAPGATTTGGAARMSAGVGAMAFAALLGALLA